MSASFPQMAFWVIFPLAVLIVLSGWVMILISAVKKLRSGKQREGNEPANRPIYEDFDDVSEADFVDYDLAADAVGAVLTDNAPTAPLA